ncbi:hypothetical protein BX600DRAFT_538842 [Xylariales sp. PMI_506]|nr:hypothetical protein BX600DRAFT_538842 [Xylariales sp. PMI_506]
MAASPSKTPGTPVEIPKRTSRERGQKQPEFDHSLQYLQALQTLDANYWLSAAAVSDISVKIYEVETRRAFQQWKQDESNQDGEEMTGWWSTPEAHHLVEKFKAATYEKKLYTKQAERIQCGGPIRRAFQALFNTSQIGLGVQKAGIGKRTRTQQSKFRQSLIAAYGAAISNPKKPKVVAAHVVPHSFGPDFLIALFGVNVEGELDTPYNGLLLPSNVEQAIDDSAIAIVPDIPDDPSTEEVEAWESAEPKQYKWRVMDNEADILDQCIMDNDSMTIRDLRGNRLFFKTAMRPRARYLYFLFVVAQLKLAWRHDYRNDPSKVLKKELVKGFWATNGRHLNRAFLLALADEIGHDTELYANIPMDPGNDHGPDETGVIGIAKLLQFRKRQYEEEFGDEDDEEQAEEYD